MEQAKMVWLIAFVGWCICFVSWLICMIVRPLRENGAHVIANVLMFVCVAVMWISKLL